MFCEKCRTQLHDDAQFCRFCGASTEPVAPASAAPPPPAAPAPLPYIPPYIPPPKAQLQQKQIGMVIALGVAMLAAIMIDFVMFSVSIGMVPAIIYSLLVLIAAVTLCAITKKWKVFWPTIAFAAVPLIGFVVHRILWALVEPSYFRGLVDGRVWVLAEIGSTVIAIAITLLQLACIVITIVLLVRDFKQSNKLNMEENRL